jgi:hypothetical protein
MGARVVAAAAGRISENAQDGAGGGVMTLAGITIAVLVASGVALYAAWTWFLPSRTRRFRAVAGAGADDKIQRPAGGEAKTTETRKKLWGSLGPRGQWLLIAVAGLFIIYIGPLMIPHPAQDACSFGPVSNERYRELLAEAERRQATVWPPLVWDNKKTMALLNARFDDLSRGMTSPYERLAAMHAIVRALGGDYRRTEFDVDDPYGPKNRSGIVAFEYHVDVNGLYFFSPLRRQMWAIAQLVISDNVRTSIIQDRRRSRIGDIEFLVWLPTIFDSYIIAPFSNFGPCPRLPPPELGERLMHPSN